MTSIRQLFEQYTTLGLVVIPVSGKRPVSVVLDEYGQPLRRPDGSLVRWQPFVERPPSDAEFQAFEWQRATGLAVVVGPATWLAWPYLWCLDIEARVPQRRRAVARPARPRVERWGGRRDRRRWLTRLLLSLASSHHGSHPLG
jgi:hypothetical protein